MTFYIQFPLVKYSEMGASQNQPIILTNRRGQNGCEFPESISKALVVLQSGQTFSTYIDTSITGLQLKELIYEKLSHLLQPKHMVLRIKKASIKDEETLDKLLTLNDVIVQEKIPPQSLSKIEYFGEVEDEISLEKGVVKMPCGHLMGRASIMSLLNCVVSSKKWEIICPHQSCNQQWDYTFCKKLAVLTSHEDKHFTTQFNKNWIQHFAKKCPGCNMAIINEDSASNKVSCLNKKCKYGYFCYLCFKKWKGLGQKDCGNDACSFKPNAKLLQQTKSMILLERQTGKQINIKIPVFRLCPKCSQPIEHVSGCKHMQCFHCKTDFCWICLTLMEHKVWSCGNYNQYCGQTAPVQEVK